MNLVEVWDAVEAVASKADPIALKAVLCMLVDYTAAKNEVSSMELLGEISSIIKSANEVLGTIEI